MSDIQFTDEEKEFLQNGHFFDLKYQITGKISNLFSEIEQNLKKTVSQSSYPFDPNVFLKAGKISRGENYNHCPYIVLDYPRLFVKNNIFALRTIFWWGHFYSNSFILSGKSLHENRSRLKDKITELKDTSWLICQYRTPWKLENEPDNYVKLSEIETGSLEKLIENHPFIKISALYSLQEYDKLSENTCFFFKRILDLLG